MMASRALRGGMLLLVVVVGATMAAPLLAPYAPDARVGVPFSAPSLAHLLGTNDIGQDLFSRLLHGGRSSLLVGGVAAAAATIVGTMFGTVAGLARGGVDAVAMRLVDVTMSVPFLPLMIVVGVFLGPGSATQVIVIAAVMWAGVARELRSAVLSLRERDHVRAAQAMGAAPGHVIAHHLLPGVVPLVVPQFVLAAKRAVMFEAALSFLGLGATGTASWGTMLFHAHQRSAFLTDAWLWWVVPPGMAIAATIIGLALVGHAVQQRLSPHLRPIGPAARRARHGSSRRIPTRAVGTTEETAPAVVSVEGVVVVYGSGDNAVTAVDGVSLRVGPGERVGIVGASGSGKSTLALAASGLLADRGRIVGGRVVIDGRDLAELSARERQVVHGGRIALMPQQSAAALNPVMRVADQVVEALRLHQPISRAVALRRAVELLASVGLDARQSSSHPHQLSGGMRQRAVLAIALANDPALLILDEPTTGLDVVAQVQLLELLDRLCREQGTAMLVVSHDLLVIAGLADRLAVMDAGRIVEEGTARQVLAAPTHERARALVAAVPPLLVTTACPASNHLREEPMP